MYPAGRSHHNLSFNRKQRLFFPLQAVGRPQVAGSPEPEPEAEAEPGKAGIGNVLQQVECFLLKAWD